MAILTGALRMIIGAIFGIASMLALFPALASVSTTNALAYSVIAIGVLLGLFAPTIRRAFGRGFLLLGVSVFALPLSALMLSGKTASDMISTADPGSEAAATVAAGIVGATVTGAASFVGFFLGAILLVIGLVLALGGRREVVIRR